MIEDSYEFQRLPSQTASSWIFKSRGRAGEVTKIVKFSRIRGCRFNLGLADIRMGQLDGRTNTGLSDENEVVEFDPEKQYTGFLLINKF